jgi:streptogramin lyase
MVRVGTLIVVGSLILVGCSEHSYTSVPPPSASSLSHPEVDQTGSTDGWQIFSLAFSPCQLAARSYGEVWGSIASGTLIGRVDMAGSGSTSPLADSNYCGPITTNLNGVIYYAQQSGSAYVVARVVPGGRVTYTPLPGSDKPVSFVSASDGSLWMTRYPATVARLTANGTYTDFSNGISAAFVVTDGPDGDIWATVENGNTTAVARYAVPSGAMTSYAIPTANYNLLISSGADGGVWVAEENQMVRIDPATGTVATYSADINAVGDMLSGPDQLLYISEPGKVVEYSPISHDVRRHVNFPSQSVFYADESMALGPDSQLWFGCLACDKVAVLLLAPIVPEPTSIVVSAGSSTPLTVSEHLQYRNQFSVISNDVNIATVSGSGKSFTVYGQMTGDTTVTVSDGHGNSLDVPVMVQ